MKTALRVAQTVVGVALLMVSPRFWHQTTALAPNKIGKPGGLSLARLLT